MIWGKICVHQVQHHLFHHHNKLNHHHHHLPFILKYFHQAMIHIITIIIINMDRLVQGLVDKWLLLLHVVQVDIQHFFLVSSFSYDN
jgi:hypothetical protein